MSPSSSDKKIKVAAIGQTVKVAAIDCGTNSIRLLVASFDPATQSLTELEPREMIINRLGLDLGKTGRLAESSLQKTYEATRHFKTLIDKHAISGERILFVATSASRDASNSEEFFSEIERILGVRPRLLSGDEEAELTFRGAVSVHGDVEFPALVIDLGGGSTEFVLGDLSSGTQSGDTGVIAGHSMDIGSVRIHERHLHSDPPTSAELEAALVDINAAIDACGEIVDFKKARSVIGVAGTVTTLTSGVLGLEVYDRDAINGSIISTQDFSAKGDEIIALSVAERAELPYINPGRRDIIDAGALIWKTCLERIGIDKVTVSENDILDGAAISIAME